MKTALQKEKESRHQCEDKASLSDSMLTIDATMSDLNDPDSTGSGQSFEEEFVMLPVPPQFVPRHLEDLEDALRCADDPPTDQRVDSKDNSIEESDGHNSQVSSKSKHDSSSDHSDNQSHDDDVSDGYGTR